MSEYDNKKEKLKQYLFVYGSLLSHNSRNYLLKDSKFIGKAILENYGLYKISWYPGIVSKEGSKVVGEVYEVDDVTLEKIDNFEGEGELYKRERVIVNLEKGEKIEAWTYVYLNEVKEENFIPFENQPWRD
ncbi:MAG: gamma-glutamylcyclotransferase family protein [Elusimicrobiota bacterium]|nr:gamma-glutamylcyclotransferase [Endomicrobiia bacterium]MDW8166347.1 gamma-glutamylcyclotransferase family protein [Elusimicrobiota bacterium]